MSFNSTIIPRKKQLSCGHYDFNFSRNRCKSCSQKQDAKPISKFSKKRESELLGGGESLQNLINDCDRLFSLVVRLRESDKEGYCSCFVCTTRDHYKNMQNSHYVKRGNMGLRFVQFNCHCSCAACNENHNYNEEPYRLAILKEHGKGVLEYLEENRNTIHKWTIGDLKDLRTELQAKINTLMIKFIK